MKLVILCGGLGTRLREETEFRPKPMIEIGGRPMLWHTMKGYAHYGVKDFVICLGYKGHMIREYFLHYQAMANDFTINLGSRSQIQFHGNHGEEDWNVTLVDTGIETLTAERIWRVRRHVADGTFMVTYGDGVSDIDIRRLLEFHHRQARLATLTGVRDMSRFGVLQTDGSHRVVAFKEKPSLQDRINAGFFVFEPGVFAYLKDQRSMLEQGPLPSLAADGQLSVYPHDGFWHCMDTYRDYLHLTQLWESGSAPWAVWRTGEA